MRPGRGCLLATILATGMIPTIAAQEPAGIPRVLDRLEHAVLEQDLDAKDPQQVELAADASKLLVATANTVVLRDLEARKTATWRSEPVAHASLAPGNRVVIACAKRVIVLDGTLQRTERSLEDAGDFSFAFAGIAPDGTVLVAAASQDVVPGSGRLLIQGPDDTRPREIGVNDRWGIRAAALAPRGGLLAVLTGGGTTQIHRLPGGERTEKLDHYYEEPDEKGVRGGWTPTALLFDRDGAVLYVADSRGFVRAWDVKASRELSRWRVNDAGAVEHLALGPCAGALFSTDASGRTRLWDVSDAANPTEVKFKAPCPGRIVFDAEGKRFAIVADGKIRVYR